MGGGDNRKGVKRVEWGIKGNILGWQCLINLLSLNLNEELEKKKNEERYSILRGKKEQNKYNKITKLFKIES